MNMRVHSSSPRLDSSSHSSHSTEPPPKYSAPSSAPSLNAPVASSASDSASGTSATSDLDTQLQNFITQIGQQILSNGRNGWANAQENDDS